jgi:SAM-dependent methyltransferase
MQPLSNAFVSAERLAEPEQFLPLRAFVCERCFLVQVGESGSPEEIFSNYAYFSSYSESWLRHARCYVEEIVTRLSIGPTSRVVEVASNDGYLLRNFAERGVPVLGIEPAANVAVAAEAAGVPTLVRFFGIELARELVESWGSADLVVGNNVLAHVPDLNGFVEGLRILLAPSGAITLEFPHLLRLLEGTQFDTIYHEHYSYFSLLTLEQVLAAHDLAIFDVDEIPTHGGSLRVYACHRGRRDASVAVRALRDREKHAGLTSWDAYSTFHERVKAAKRALLSFLIAVREEGRRVVGYGAAAKGNTLLNYCGIRTDLLDYVVDRNPHKQGHFLPGTHIPVHAPECVDETHPDYVLILPWNLRDEIMQQMERVREWGCRFAVPIPSTEVLE